MHREPTYRPPRPKEEQDSMRTKVLVSVGLVLVLVLASVGGASAAPRPVTGLVIPAASKQMLASYDDPAARARVEKLGAEKRALWEKTQDPKALDEFMAANGYRLVATGSVTDPLASGDISLESTPSQCTRSISVYVSTQDGTTVIDCYYDWSSWDSEAGGSDMLYTRFYRGITNPSGASPYLETVEANWTSSGTTANDLIWVYNYEAGGAGVIWELQDQNVSGGVYDTDNGFTSLAIPPQSGSNTVIFGMAHTWNTTEITSISISINPDGTTTPSITWSSVSYRWQSEIQKSLY